MHGPPETNLLLEAQDLPLHAGDLIAELAELGTQLVNEGQRCGQRGLVENRSIQEVAHVSPLLQQSRKSRAGPHTK
jgi:hypothetical protein